MLVAVRSESRPPGVTTAFMAFLMTLGALFLLGAVSYLGWERWRMRAWQPVPMLVESAEVRRSPKTMSRAQAVYRYQYAGQSYEGERTTISPFSDSFSSFHKRVVRMLREHMQSGEPYIGYVNPRFPSESVLVRVLPGSSIGFITLLAMWFFQSAFSILRDFVKTPMGIGRWKKVRAVFAFIFLLPLWYLTAQSISDGIFLSYLIWFLISLPIAAYFFRTK